MTSVKKVMILIIFLLFLTMKTFISYETEEYVIPGAWGVMIKVLPGEKVENGIIWHVDNDSNNKIYITLKIENVNSEYAKWVQINEISKNIPIYSYNAKNITANIEIPDNACPGTYSIFDLIIERGSKRANKYIWRKIKVIVEVKRDKKEFMLNMIYNSEGEISRCREKYKGINLDEAITYISKAKTKLGRDNFCECFYDEIPLLLEKAENSIEMAKEKYNSILKSIELNENLIKENEYTGADFTDAMNLLKDSYNELYNGDYITAIEKANLIESKITEAINKIKVESQNKINEADNQFNIAENIQSNNPEYLKKAQEFEIDTKNIENYYKTIESDMIESEKYLKRAKIDFQNKRYGDSIDKAEKSIQISKQIIKFSDMIKKETEKKILQKRIFYLGTITGLLVGFFALVLKRY
ncbi:hypothetical protein DRN58_03420 [Thermococci archaeon]|nr:MAG: hypothetical protein DRN58_03420 [Thermococci archaeon]